MLSKQRTISIQRPRKQFSMTSAAGLEIIVVDALWRDVLLLQQLACAILSSTALFLFQGPPSS